jgi:hypothetical protein
MKRRGLYQKVSGTCYQCQPPQFWPQLLNHYQWNPSHRDILHVPEERGIDLMNQQLQLHLGDNLTEINEIKDYKQEEKL